MLSFKFLTYLFLSASLEAEEVNPIAGQSRALHFTQIRPLHAKTGRQCGKPMRTGVVCSEVKISQQSGYPTAPFRLPGPRMLKCDRCRSVGKEGKRFSHSKGNRSMRGFAF
ncbi:hypothetical protein AVEN_94069-1 [Araneus ventricosus]|uniref:Secreted protein n=1 Tax=Araneus ventricosus TaxID=182803 RepID=A0A4Y2NS50_ARAVE|nr:hypothetical protein AVEN_69564-1 [Araneus ventricosus]GBN43005.1 hypothetical protein AVEN_94069-1 [Araneus ventricosus]